MADLEKNKGGVWIARESTDRWSNGHYEYQELRAGVAGDVEGPKEAQSLGALPWVNTAQVSRLSSPTVSNSNSLKIILILEVYYIMMFHSSCLGAKEVKGTDNKEYPSCFLLKRLVMIIIS